MCKRAIFILLIMCMVANENNLSALYFAQVDLLFINTM